MSKQSEYDSVANKINLDYDWNSDYGDGDIPRIDKSQASDAESAQNSSSRNVKS